MTTGFERSQIREQDKRCAVAADSLSMALDSTLQEWQRIRIAMAATSGGSSAALLTSVLSSWATAFTAIKAARDAADALRISQLGQGNAND